MGLTQEESLDQIAGALEKLAIIAEKFYLKLYPERKIVREPLITRVESDEDRAKRERLQGSEETTDEWKDIGRREKEFLDKSKKGS